VPFVRFHSPKNKEGEQSADRGWCGSPHPATCLATGHLRIAGDDRWDTPAGAPFGALLRRFPYGVGPRFLRRSFTPPSASSWRGIVVSPGRGEERSYSLLRNSSGTIGASLELRSVSEVLTLRTAGAAVNSATKA